MIDLQTGNIMIYPDLILHSNLTFLEFKKTSFYNNQNPNKIIYLVEPQIIDDKKYIVSLFFRDGKIYSFSLLNIDFDFTVETEKERKQIHDKILLSYQIVSGKKYSWGMIESEYDSRSNISSINIFYHNYLQE
ncbi:hypothetical protein [Pseudolactococcus raffinolactis]|jgi:hypothetical protein|uniref:hypothetical protein n=1 Tax=Pseudolactococcus raffinolactis TaxID=1366 RepID=UPI00077BB78B|nr:hypothetical protein [Lactococcus raffinolactis]MBW9298358.1 hypothetical protein [Lactococcus raffinolactis]TLQ14683.1 hypothetical protein FEZ46_05215 [Lactococcus raffinolactis]HBZ60206.1 hypothetical protein [Lactococcus sp.]